MNDWELIQRWTLHRDETAFGELVRKHLPFVFACARRQVGPDAAYDLSQSVFLILARKANSFGPDIILSSWLFRTTGFAVAQWRRHEARRTRRETAALPMITPALHASRDPDEAWREPLETHLDDALSALSESDRNYVLTRFFERRRFSEVAERFGVSEDAAKKRVARALERMRAHLVARGVAIPATVLGGLLLQPRAEALPEHLAAAVLRTIRDTAISTASQGPVADLAQATLRQATVNSFGRMAIRLLTGLAGAALVWTGVSAARSALRTPPTESSASAEPAPALASEVLASRAPASTDTQGASLALTLLDATTDRPIADAAIEASQIFATTDDTVDRSEFRTLSTVTDDAGRAVFRLGDRSFARVVVAVSVSRYVVTHLEWRGYEFASGSIDHVCRLLPGVRLTGEVKDPENRPVAEARVILTGETGYEDGARESGTQELALVTDAEGRFESDRVAPRRETFRTRNAGRRLAIRVVHPDFAIGWGELPFDTDPTNHVVLRLHRGSTLAGRILDPSGAPIIGAVVRESAFSGPDREAVSGPTGEFELTRLGSIPLIEGPKVDTPVRFGFEVRAAGYRRLEADVAPMTASEAYVHRRSALPGQENSSESVPIVAHPRHPGEVGPAGFRVVLDLVLDPGETLDDDTVTVVPSFPRPPGPIQLRGTVLDDVSGAPVPRFRIATKYRGNEFRTLIGEGRDGAFEWLLPDTSPLALQPPTEIFEQNGFSWPPPETMTFKLVLEANADGYMPAEIETFVENGAMRPVEFRLSGGDEVSGWIELPNTRPAVGALVGLGGEGTAFVVDAGGGFGWATASTPQVRSDSDGAFGITRTPRADRLQVVHPEGCAIFPLPASPNTIIRLEPWASLEGELRSETGTSLAGIDVRLEPETPPPGTRPYAFEFRYATRTDGEGRFRFDRVPPGRLVVTARDATENILGRVRLRSVRGTRGSVRLDLP